LGVTKDKIKYVKNLSPFLINISNNHINDYGNASCSYTENLLQENGFKQFGIGYIKRDRNIHVDNKNKIVHISFITRSTDTTGHKLFAEIGDIGGYPPDIEQIKNIKREYSEFFLIVNIHWGIEDIRYPEPEKRELAYELIDCGVDLIIGHHPHIVQPYEKYKNRWIFYSLGN